MDRAREGTGVLIAPVNDGTLRCTVGPGIGTERAGNLMAGTVAIMSDRFDGSWNVIVRTAGFGNVTKAAVVTVLSKTRIPFCPAPPRRSFVTGKMYSIPFNQSVTFNKFL
jgi:hypothetical protein